MRHLLVLRKHLQEELGNLGVALIGKKRGDNFSFNGLVGVVVPRRGVEPPLP